MNKKITDTIVKFNMLSQGDTVLLAVSGGADSMLMLDYFVKNKDSLSLKLKVAHIEHGIRGAESKGDALLVEKYCRKHNIEFNLLSIDAVSEAKALGLGVEEYARNRRYAFFDTIECDKIATAHNLTDNIETVIYRLIRGTGIKGICGIPPVRGKIIRPLIEIESSEIRSYCDNNGIEYRVDSTNICNDYSRNKIRNCILPLFAELNTSYEVNIANFISDINEDYDLIENYVNSLYGSTADQNGLLIAELKKYDTSVQKRIIKRFFSENQIELDRIHLQKTADLIYRSGRVQLCGNVFAVSNKTYLRAVAFNDYEKDFSFVSEILNINEFKRKNIDFYCDCDKIIGSVTVRARKAGDKIIPAGRGCEKSLKKLFNELQIPVEKRDSVGVVCDACGVIGIIGYCVAERVKTDKFTKNVIAIKFPLED